MNRLDKLTQDYLHQLELDNLKCAERSKVATQLAICRKNRRYYKDKVEELQSLIDFLGEVENKKVIEKLKKKTDCIVPSIKNTFVGGMFQARGQAV